MVTETRVFLHDKAELRASAPDDAVRSISGHFALFNRFSPVYGRFREKIDPGFFNDALPNSDVRALFNHNESAILGRKSAGTLRLAVDEKGLFGEISPVPDTPTGNEVLQNVRLGNLTGASFAFNLTPEGGDKWAKAADGVWERTLMHAGEVFDVSVVTQPFYPETSVAARAVNSDLERSFTRWVEEHPEEGPELVHELLDLLSLGG